MKTLPLKFRKRGFEYTQVLRGNRSCIYMQTVCPKVSYFEVFLIKLKPACEIQGKFLPLRERFPHDEAFGIWAWSFREFEKANRKFIELETEGHFS